MEDGPSRKTWLVFSIFYFESLLLVKYFFQIDRIVSEMFLQVALMQYCLIFVSFLCILSLKYVLKTKHKLRGNSAGKGEAAQRMAF